MRIPFPSPRPAARRLARLVALAGCVLACAGASGCAGAEPVAGTDTTGTGGNGGDGGSGGVTPPPGGSAARIDTIFLEGFESGNLSAWDDGANAAKHRVATDAAFAHGGSRYLDVTHPQGDDGGFLNKFFMPGYDSVYVRYWVRLEPEWQGGTKFVALYGSRLDNQWSAFGQAGVCPSGTDFFASMVVSEPTGGNPGLMRFYTYYPQMQREPDGRTCWGNYGDGTTQYFTPLTFSLGSWHKVEFWLRANRVGSSDAFQRFWLDGTLKGEWGGFALRNTTNLRINALQLTFSICCGGAPRTQHAYVDDILVATARPANP